MQLTPVTTSTAENTSLPSKTWKIDFEKKKITGMIGGLEALRQAVFLCLNTERYEYAIFSWDYGVEMQKLIGQSYDLVRKEMQTAIEEALSVDDRIKSVGDFTFTRSGDALTVTFKVTSSDGSVLSMEVDTSV